MNAQKKYLIFGLVLLFSLDLYANYWPGQQEKYILRNWTIESGLPQNTIQSMVQTQDGYIWIGTPAGLARFDGVRFTVYTKQNTPSLKNDNILSLYEDYNQVLWIGTDGGGLCSFKNGKWQNYSMKNGLSNEHVRAIVADWQGNLWIGTEYGLNRLHNNEIKVFTIDDGLLDNIITALSIDYYGYLWVGTLQGGLARIEKEAVQIFDHKDGLESKTINSITVDSNGLILVGTFNGIYIKDQTADFFYELPRLYNIPITSILETNTGLLWAGTMVDGLFRIPKANKPIKEKITAIPDDYVRCLLKDREDHIWIGTDTAGLIQIKLRKVQAITREHGLPENGVSTVIEDRNGNLWIGLRNRGLCKRTPDGVIRTVSNISGVSNQGISVLFEDLDGAIWCGTNSNGVFKIRNNLSLRLTKKDGLPSNAVTSIFRDGNNSLWIGTDLGLCSYNQGHIVQKDRGHLKNKKINVLFEGYKGILYAGTNDGLYGRFETRWEVLDSALSSEVLALYEDEEGILWIGTNGDGLKIWKDGQVSTITKAQGLYDDCILSISLDAGGYLWMSTYKGVFSVKRNQLLNSIRSEDQIVYPIIYDEYDGMPSRQCSGNVSPAVWNTVDRKLLFPTVKGISIFDSQILVSDSIPPQLILEKIVINDQSILIDTSEMQRFSDDNFEFFFTAFDYSAAEKLFFEYMLEGYDEKYLQLLPDKERHVSYENLGAGTYHLLVKVTNRQGIQNKNASLIRFEIFTPFYAHPIFIMLVVMTVLIVSSSLVYLRHQRKVNRHIEKYKTSRLDKEMADKTKEKIKILMTTDKLYLDPDLTLKDLSSRLNLHSNHISRIINEKFEMSYNDYINMHRIEDVKEKLLNPETNTKTVLEIMYETGFYSKSVFNTAFKKFTGITPSEYRKTHAPTI